MNYINYEQRQAEAAFSAELTQLQCKYATLVDDNKKLVERCEERQKEVEEARSRTKADDEACQAALSAKRSAEAARQTAEMALKHSEQQRQDVVDAAVAAAVASQKVEYEKLQQKVAKLTEDAMSAFEEGERVTAEQWEEAYLWGHEEEQPQVPLSLMQKYVQYLKRKANCEIAGMDPPSPFHADDDDDDEEGEEDEEGAEAAEEDESEEVLEDAATK